MWLHCIGQSADLSLISVTVQYHNLPNVREFPELILCNHYGLHVYITKPDLLGWSSADLACLPYNTIHSWIFNSWKPHNSQTGYVIICACAHCLQSAPAVWLLGMSPVNLIDSQVLSISAFKVCFFTQEALNLILSLTSVPYQFPYNFLEYACHYMDPFTM